MRRLARYTLNALTVLSLVMCVGTVGLWVRSYSACESLCWDREVRAVSLSDLRGGIELYWWEASADEGSEYKMGIFYFRSPPQDASLYDISGEGEDWPVFDRAGFALVGGRWRDSKHWTFVLPFWSLTVLLAVLPTRRLWRTLRRANLESKGQCATCGYDLRATPDRCPECGMVVSSEA